MRKKCAALPTSSVTLRMNCSNFARVSDWRDHTCRLKWVKLQCASAGVGPMPRYLVKGGAPFVSI